ncbi:ArsS family sensor histidine kinase [Sulfurimonas autotrophica]|uniref:histidine kinase n=1 Tax=Sulfurimonas autotrophica (strain ATCC BAA-671 / DSM 16294 / JCM 11897 / OK10) TaxID=563040 RepID=E0UPB2_SULAO|nr:ArsS family sensor histidine kinase [Sulfurimonas autotrophica]ADN08576.1 integral membrane sensor signal transduction histidine kinase [Sulfurimonas autotrophica DSM 16294]
MIKRHAVLLTVLFALTVSLVSLSAIFWEFYKLNKEQYINHIFTKYSVITQIYREHQQRQSSEIMLEANLAVYNLEVTKDEKLKKEIFEKGKILKREGFKSFNTSLLINDKGLYTKNVVTNLRATMIQYKRNIYFHIETPNGDILIKDNELKPYSYINLLYSYITIFMIISLSFILILQRLRPLIRLRKKIELYGNGNMDISFKTNRDDEIGAVANELEHARQKINTILESRTLFLRNLMHELKTPIAKGTIATQMLDSQKQRDRFSSIFKRLETLVTEFAMIEEVTSLDDKKDFSEYRLLDVIDGAIDMAMVDKEHVTMKISGKIKVHVNYRLYTTAIKNMIDNAMKYSTDSHITILMNDKNELCFESKGECLAHPLQYYIEPFTKENPSKNSFGLGLYLVDSILKAHGEVLAHEYENGVNRFIFA